MRSHKTSGVGIRYSLIFLALLLASAPAPIFAGGRGEATEAPSEGAERQAAAESIEVSLVVPTGVPAISVAALANRGEPLLAGYQTSIDVVTSPDVMGSRLISGDADVAIVPTNLAVSLHNRDVDVRLAGVAVWGILYLVAREPIDDWQDLTGRELGMFGRGLTPDIVFRHIARARGLNPESDLTLRYVNATTELAPAFIAGEIDISMMPEPMLTRVLQRSDDAVVAFNMQEEWAEVTGTGRGFPQAALVFSGVFADEHPAYAAAFVRAFAESVEQATSDPATTAEQAAELIPDLPAPVIEAAMPRANLEFVDAVGARPALETYVNILVESDVRAVGGALPGDEFYYTP